MSTKSKDQTKDNDETLEDEIVEEAFEDIEEETVSKQEFLDLQDKYNKVEGSYQRLLADFENYKRRTAGEILDSRTQGKIEVLEKIVDIVDNFDRSMMFDVQTEEFKKGITMLHSMFGQRLEGVGLEEVQTDGELDPNIHQAIGTDNKDDMEDDHITEVLQKGYKVGDKLIRPAMVKVNKKEKKDKK